jgi:hypothetical protein
MNELLLIAVPGGKATDSTATLRALVVHKLDTSSPQPLKNFGLQDWPAILSHAATTFKVVFDSLPDPITVTPVAASSSDLWRSFFSEDTPVNPRQQRAYVPVVAPTSEHAASIRGTYTESARAIADPTVDSAQAIQRQYERPEWANAPAADPPGPIGPEEWQKPDFHRVVALMREHPAVLKQLGLILEFGLAINDIPRTTATGPQLVHLECSLGVELPGDWQMVTPGTRFELEDVHFLPAPDSSSDVRSGMLDLAGTKLIEPKLIDADEPQPVAGTAPAWSMVTFDVAGGVARLRDAARSGGVSPGSPNGVSLPVLRSAGLALMRSGRDELMKQRAQNNSGTVKNELTADDLLLGYRVDIREQSVGGATGEWFPLCERKATYRVGDQIIGAEGQVEEGHVKANAAVVGTDNVLRADEVVTRWTGWNLVIPRPVFDRTGLRRSSATPLELPFDFSWDFTLSDRKLGPLRFGRGYQMRVRVADMAGGGLEVDDVTGSDRATGQILYRRHEPIPPPEFAPPKDMFVIDPATGETQPNHAALGPGGDIDCLVIRSDPGPPGTNGPDVDEFATQHPEYPDNDNRIMLPPPTSLSLAEQHGRLDGTDADGEPVDDAVTFGWVQRATTPPGATDDGVYNWLADPAAVGVMVTVRSGADSPAPDASDNTAWEPKWPEFDPKFLRLQAREDGQRVIEWVSASPGSPPNVFVVRLKAGEEADIEITSYANAQKIDELEGQDWLQDQAESLISTGRHPMVTPPRLVKLLHAVRQPLAVPAATLQCHRAVGATSVVLADSNQPRLGVDRKSTSQIDVSANWDEFGDSETPNPMTEKVVSLKVDRAADELPELRHEFGDTRHRRITYTLTALSRFRQFFDPGPDEAFETAAVLEEVRIPSSARPAPPVVLAVSPSFHWEGTVDLSAGPVQRRRLGGRIRVELARPWNLSGQEERLAVVTLPSAPTLDEMESGAGHVSRAFRDPIWPTGPTVAFVPDVLFTGAVSDTDDCTLAETGQKARAVPYAVHLDEQNDRWYADIEFPQPATESYGAFVRLAVARYQKESLVDPENLKLSPTVTCDFVQVMPDRTLSIEQAGGALQVQLDGLAPLGPKHNQVIVVIEQCEAQPGASVSDLTSALPDVSGMWHRVPGHSVSGTLNAPLPPLPVPAVEGLLRVVVREVEDIDPAVPTDGDDSLSSELRQRTIFLDVVGLTGA